MVAVAAASRRERSDSVSNVELREQRGQGRVQPLIQRAKLAIATRRGSIGVGFDSSPSPRHPVGGRDDVPFPAHGHSGGGQDCGTECRRLRSGRDFDGPLERVRNDAHPQAALGPSSHRAEAVRVDSEFGVDHPAGACEARTRSPRVLPGTCGPDRAVLAVRPMLRARPHPSRVSRHASDTAGTVVPSEPGSTFDAASCRRRSAPSESSLATCCPNHVSDMAPLVTTASSVQKPGIGLDSVRNARLVR